MKETLTYRDSRNKIVYLKNLISGKEIYLRKVKYEPVEKLGYTCFYDTRINRYIIYKYNNNFQSVRGLSSEWSQIDNENRKALGLYSKMMVCEGYNRCYRHLGYWVVEELQRAKINSRQDLQDVAFNLDKPMPGEIDFCAKMSVLLYEAYKDIENIEKGRIVHGFGAGPASRKPGSKNRVNVFIGAKTGKVLGVS